MSLPLASIACLPSRPSIRSGRAQEPSDHYCKMHRYYIRGDVLAHLLVCQPLQTCCCFQAITRSIARVLPLLKALLLRRCCLILL